MNQSGYEYGSRLIKDAYRNLFEFFWLELLEDQAVISFMSIQFFLH